MIRTLLEEFVIPLLLFLLVRSLLKGWFGAGASRRTPAPRPRTAASLSLSRESPHRLPATGSPRSLLPLPCSRKPRSPPLQ